MARPSLLLVYCSFLLLWRIEHDISYRSPSGMKHPRAAGREAGPIPLGARAMYPVSPARDFTNTGNSRHGKFDSVDARRRLVRDTMGGPDSKWVDKNISTRAYREMDRHRG